MTTHVRIPNRCGSRARLVACRVCPQRSAEAGSESLTVAIISAGLIAGVLGAVLLGGRYTSVRINLEDAAQAAARAASIERSPATARSSARTAAQQALAGSRTNCLTTTVTLDASGYATEPGTDAKVPATVTCTISTSGLVPGLHGTKTFSATASSPLDTHRER